MKKKIVACIFVSLFCVSVLPQTVFAGTPEIVIDGKVVQESEDITNATAQKVLDALAKYQKQLESDKKKGIRWVYSNKKKYKEEWWSNALSTGKRGCNCALLARWALRDAGVLEKGDGGFYGEKHSQIVWSGRCESVIKDKCDMIYIGGKKTVQQLLDADELQPGDILTYDDIGHTNIYAGDNMWYDAGHTFCKGSGELAKFDSFYGKRSNNHKVGYIIRVKDMDKIVVEDITPDIAVDGVIDNMAESEEMTESHTKADNKDTIKASGYVELVED